jgi:hypothetical protein
MVFVPTNFWANIWIDAGGAPTPAFIINLNLTQRTTATNLCDKQLTGYTFIAKGAMGDQPGNHQWHYLAPWQTLPDNTFIAEEKFVANYTITDLISGASYSISQFNYINAVPFPTEDSPLYINVSGLPCIAFNYLGQLTTNGVDAIISHEYIPLARGSVLPAINPATRAYQFGSPSVSENPPGNSVNAYNIIDIEPLTGRAVLEYQKVKN